MKKIAIGVIAIVGLFILFLIYDFMVVVPTIAVENVVLLEAEPLKKIVLIHEYAVNENDKRRLAENNTLLKTALITLKCDNPSFFNSFYEVRGTYATPEKLPPIIVGEKPRMASEDVINIFSRTHQLKRTRFKMAVLIDPTKYSDTEILEILKSVDVKLVGSGTANVLATLPLAK